MLQLQTFSPVLKFEILFHIHLITILFFFLQNSVTTFNWFKIVSRVGHGMKLEVLMTLIWIKVVLLSLVNYKHCKYHFIWWNWNTWTLQTMWPYGRRVGFNLFPPEELEGLWKVPPQSSPADLCVRLLWGLR